MIILSLFLNFLLFNSSHQAAAQEKDDLRMNFITMAYSITPNEDASEVNFLAYLPIITDDSIPVLVKLSQEDSFNLNVSGFNFKTIKNDKNLIRFHLKNCIEGVKTFIVFELYTLKKFSLYHDLPEMVTLKSYSALDTDKKYYTQSSLSIQCDSPEMRKKAFEFLYKGWSVGNVVDVLKDIMDFTGNVVAFSVAPGGQTALATLNRNAGVCTGKANLAVGLCRALGIPARVLHVLASHFIIEAWIPGYGWVRGEPTKGLFPHPRHIWTTAWIVDIEDENYAGQYTGGIVAYLGLEKDVNATWMVEYDEIAQESRWIEEFVTIESNSSLNDNLFKKGAELWRFFCRLKNAGLSYGQLATFSSYHNAYFTSLVNKDISTALNWAELAIFEAKNLLNWERHENYNGPGLRTKRKLAGKK